MTFISLKCIPPGIIPLTALFASTFALAAPQDVEDADDMEIFESAEGPADAGADADYQPPGMDPFTTGLVQVAAGMAVGTAIAPLNTATCGLFGCLAGPAVIGYAETWAGDYVGQQRGAAIYPIAAQYAFGIAATAASIALPFVFPVSPSASSDIGQNIIRQISQPNFWIVQGTGIAISAVGATVIPIVYYLTAEDKQPGDTGQGLPGVYSPAHKPATARAPVAPMTDAEMAMAF